jgi:hypothetical protein
MTDSPTGGLDALLEVAAADLASVERREGNAVVEWSTGGIVFAAVNGARAEFRLAPAVVAAALRTPDTGRSERGADWVAFAPSELDGHAIDRAEAWLASAWRRAGSEV